MFLFYLESSRSFLYALILFSFQTKSQSTFPLAASIAALFAIFSITSLMSAPIDEISFSHSAVWSFFYFSHNLYLLFIFSAVLYLLSNLNLFSMSNSSSRYTSFDSIDGLHLLKLFLTPLLLFLLVHVSWSGPSLIAWFGHVIFSKYQYKVTYLLLAFFTSFILIFLSTVHYSALSVYDFSITVFNFFFWVWLMFFSNNLFTFIFFLELLSASITLLLVTSTFSSLHFYNPSSYSNHSYFQLSTPSAFLQTLLFFFWITLVSSLTLFVFLLVFYLKFLTFDWSFTDALFGFIVDQSSLKSLFSTVFSFLLLLISIFLKCGVAPLYLWKPSFFKGMSLTTLFFYVYVYYFAIFLYFLTVIFVYLNEIFLFSLSVLTALILLATLQISFLLLESFYIKSFLALSSILNSVFVLYMLAGAQSVDFLFYL